MKTILPILFLLLSVGSLIGQKHAFGIKAGAQFPNNPPTAFINTDDVQVAIGVYFHPRFHYGVFYRHQLTERFFLEVAPNIHAEKHLITHKVLQNDRWNQNQSQARNTLLYLPTSIRIDMGHQLFFSLGVGSTIVLDKKNIFRWFTTQQTIPTEAEQKSLNEIFGQLKNTSINIESGIAYGFGRFSIGGKYIYRTTKAYNDIPIQGQDYPVKLKTNYLQLEVSYQLGKSPKN